jgi:hypothetical protein
VAPSVGVHIILGIEISPPLDLNSTSDWNHMGPLQPHDFAFELKLSSRVKALMWINATCMRALGIAETNATPSVLGIVN